MENFTIQRIDTNKIVLKFSEFENYRVKTKLKIFINSLNGVSFLTTEDGYLLALDVYDKSSEAIYLSKIIEFFKKSNYHYILSPEIEDSLNEYTLKQNEIAETKQTLKIIKNSNLNSNDDFLNFKNFCIENLKVTLRDYQYKSAFLLSVAKSGFDFSVPGAGKTIISYASYKFLKENDSIERLLIIGPKNAYNAWYDEYFTCFGIIPSFENLSFKTVREVKNYFLLSKNNLKEITFINIDKIRYLEKELKFFIKHSKTLLIIDEGHKVKNPTAIATQISMEISKYTNYKIILTGTPMPNGYEDLYSLSTIASNGSLLMPFDYSQLKSFTKHGIDEKNERQLMDSLNPYYSRVSKQFLISLGELRPPKYDFLKSSMSNEQRLIYDFLCGISLDLFNKWESEFNFVLMKAILIRKMQVSANPKLLKKTLISTYTEIFFDNYDSETNGELSSNDFEKTKKLLELADAKINEEIRKSAITNVIKQFYNDKLVVNKNQLAVDLVKKFITAKEKVILWDTFTVNMETLKVMIKEQLGQNAGIINGNVIGAQRQQIINDFRDGELSILIASPATLAESISLHRACQNAIYVNRNYNAAQFIQSKDRIHRINMPNGTTANYFFLLNEDSVDEAVNDRLKIKEDRMLKILDSDEIIIGDIESGDIGSLCDEDVLTSYQK